MSIDINILHKNQLNQLSRIGQESRKLQKELGKNRRENPGGRPLDIIPKYIPWKEKLSDSGFTDLKNSSLLRRHFLKTYRQALREICSQYIFDKEVVHKIYNRKK